MYLAGASLPTVGRGKRAGIRVISDTGNHTRMRRQPQCDLRIYSNGPDNAQSRILLFDCGRGVVWAYPASMSRHTRFPLPTGPDRTLSEIARDSVPSSA